LVTKREIRENIQRDMREARSGQTSGSYFSDDDIDDAANDGYMEMSDAAEWFEEYLEFDLLKDRRYYDLFTLIGKVFLSIRPAFDEQVNRWLVPSTVRELDQRDPRWERVVGRPQRIFLRGLRWLGFWPRYGSDGTTVKQYYTRLPVPLCAETDEPGFPEAYHMGIVYFAETELYATDGETTLALESWKSYLAMEKELTAWVNKREDRPLGRVLGSATVPR
jgi:hypothetical protein